jgi:hypothetical protein
VAFGARLPGEVSDRELRRAAEHAASLVVPAAPARIEPPVVLEGGPERVVAAAPELLRKGTPQRSGRARPLRGICRPPMICRQRGGQIAPGS